MQSDRAGGAIDCLDRLERCDQLAFPEPTPGDDLIRTIGVSLVAHPTDAPQLTPGSVDDSVTFGRGKQPSQFAQSARPRAAPLLHARRLRSRLNRSQPSVATVPHRARVASQPARSEKRPVTK